MKKIKGINSIEQLENYIAGKEIICFGAGKRLDEICRDVPFILDKVKYVVDNNKILENTERIIANKYFKIFTPEKMLNEDLCKAIMIITSSYKKEIMSQLYAIEELELFEWIDFEEIMDIVAWNKKLPSDINCGNRCIPKIINYIWFSNNPLPKRLQNYVDGWKRLCPDYEIVCWNEENYDITKHPYMLQAYKDKKWSFVSDYARLDIIYSCGGLYFDTDVEMIRRPDELLYREAFIGFERLSTVNSGSGFGARKGMPLIKELRDSYDNVEFVNYENPNDMILCPIYETEILKSHGLQLDGNFQIVDGLAVYPVEYFNAKSLYSDKLLITDNTISIHHCSWTWAGNKNKL